MTDHQLSTLVRAHVADDEPRFDLDPQRVVLAGRSRLRRRRLAVGAAGLVVVALVAAGAVVGGGLPRTVGPSHGTYDGSQMPGHIRSAVSAAAPRDLDLPSPTIYGRDGGDTDLPARYLDKASGFVAVYRLTPTDTLEVRAFHSGLMARDRRPTWCPTNLSRGAVDCDTSGVARGWTLLTVTMPVVHFSLEQPFPRRPGSLLEWRTVPGATKPLDQLWWERRAETVRTGTLVVIVSERVKATTRADAERRWAFSPRAMRAIATDPGLTFTRPPEDPSNTCDWVAPRYRDNIECNGRFSDPEE